MVGRRHSHSFDDNVERRTMSVPQLSSPRTIRITENPVVISVADTCNDNGTVVVEDQEGDKKNESMMMMTTTDREVEEDEDEDDDNIIIRHWKASPYAVGCVNGVGWHPKNFTLCNNSNGCCCCGTSSSSSPSHSSVSSSMMIPTPPARIYFCLQLSSLCCQFRCCGRIGNMVILYEKKNKNNKKRKQQHQQHQLQQFALTNEEETEMGFATPANATDPTASAIHPPTEPVLMVGPYWPCMLFVTYPLLLGLSAAVIVLDIIPRRLSSSPSWEIIVVWSLGTIGMLVALARVSCRNPGILIRRSEPPSSSQEQQQQQLSLSAEEKEQAQQEEDSNASTNANNNNHQHHHNEELPLWTWNDQTLSYRPNHARYCNDCAIMVENYDHTCPWTGTAIGKNNIASFQVFLCLTVIMVIFDAALIGMRLQ